MKLSCTQENLAKGLGIVGRSVGTRATLPVLNNILLRTENGRLRLSATDLEIGINTWIGAKVDMDGAITVPAKLLVDYVNTNNDKTIILELKDTTLKLSSDRYKANIKGIESSEFPLIPEVVKDIEIEVSTHELALGIGRTVIAAALDESRPVLAGVCLQASGNKMKLVATDSYRLAEQTLTLTKKIDKDVSIIVPQRTMVELARILNDSVETVKIYPGENQVEFVIGESVLVSRLIEGIFPDYNQIIPTGAKTKFEMNRAEFANAIKMASLFAKESANNIKIKVEKQGTETPENQEKIQIFAVSPHTGDNVSEVNAKITGENLEIAFNAKFVMDVLNVIDSDTVGFELSGNLTAGLVRGNKAANYLYLLMPLRVDE